MAGYAKVWNNIWNDEWFIGLKGNERGFFLQLISFAKARGDKSEIFLRNFQAFSHEFAFDLKTVRKMLGKFHQDSRIKLTVGDNQTVKVDILNWQYWQQVKTVKGDTDDEKKHGKIRGKSSLPDHTRPYQTIPDNICAGAPKVLDPHEQLRRKDLEKIVIEISKLSCMRGEKNPYGIAGKLVKIYENDPVFTLAVVKDKADIFGLCKDAAHLIASATATYRKAGDIRDIQSAAHKAEEA